MLEILKKPKIIVFIISAVILIIGGVYKVFVSGENNLYSLAQVERRDIVQEVSAVGQVKKGEEINLGFEEGGRIEKIYVKIGDKVRKGEKLMKLSTTQLSIQLDEAKASLKLAQAQLDKLLAGARPEEIQIARTVVENAQISLENAQKDLENAKTKAAENLRSAYESALTVLDSAEIKVSAAASDVDLIQRTYFTSNDQDSINVREQKSIINDARKQIEHYLSVAKQNPTNENIDVAISKTKTALERVYNALVSIRETCEKPAWKNVVSSTYKSYLDTDKTYINTSLSNVINSQQTISLTKITNKSIIDSAQAAVDSAQGALKSAQDELALKLAKPRQEDIDLYQAKLDQAKAKVRLLEDQIYKATLRSPVDGQVVKINKEIGEQVMIGEPVIVLIPSNPFQIELDIAEVDIGKMRLGNPAKITLDAFPGVEFSGRVIEIDPAQTIIGGVVYYKSKVSLDTTDKRIKPGMTANVDIVTDSRSNVLAIPSRAVLHQDKKSFVRVPYKKGYKLIEVSVGLKGSDGYVEIISGLKEGDKVITFLKKK